MTSSDPFSPNSRIDAAIREMLPHFSATSQGRMDVTRRPAGKWIVDFGWTMSDTDAALYEEPFRWVKEHVYPMRCVVRRKAHRERWWRHADPRPGMWAALEGLSRYIATPTLAKHRLFVWCDVRICPDHQLIAIARDDDTTFGILHSRFHEIWSLRLGTSLEDRPRYTPTSTFDTFPFPPGLTPETSASDYADDPSSVAVALEAQRLVELRRPAARPAGVGRVNGRVGAGLHEAAGPARRAAPPTSPIALGGSGSPMHKTPLAPQCLLRYGWRDGR